MAEPQRKLADSLALLQTLQAGGRRVIRSSELPRVDRERLERNGFLRRIIKGWLISTGPEVRDGDSTPWYASFWQFCALYCTERFGDRWHLSPEQSLLLHAGNTTIPTQVIVYSPHGTNNAIDLPFDTSLYDLGQDTMETAENLTTLEDLRLYTIPAALTRVPEAFFQRSPIDANVVLSQIGDPGELLRPLLRGGRSTIAGRLAGAFRRIDREEIADDIVSAMSTAGYSVRVRDPFEPDRGLTRIPASASPIVARLQSLWEANRESVLESFPEPPGLPKNPEKYLRVVDQVYVSDAYHSLSIEGYRVTPDVIDRVRSGEWNPEGSESDRRSHDALAARGYWQAFELVREDIARIISGTAPGNLVRKSHRQWFRELFQPCVEAGIIDAESLAGYRNIAVYLRGSRHVPPRFEVVREAMPALFDLLQEEPEASVRAVLGHWLFGYVHPYPDGNGRLARFLMNAMLASGGYPWTVIRVEDRDEYLAALERASVEGDVGPFARFVGERMVR